MSSTTSANELPSQAKSAFAWGVSLAIALRIALGAVMAAAWLAVAPNLPPTSAPSLYGKLQMPTSRLGQLLLGVWPRWDAVHHLNLAMRGYFDLSPGDSVFYPLYAGVTRLVALAFGDEFILAGLVVSTVSTAVALAFLFLLGDLIFRPPSGKWAAIGFALYPTAVFLVAPFTESLFIALTLSAIYFAYKDKWLLSGFLALLASLTRGPGVFLALPLAVIALQRVRATPSEERHRPPISTLAAIAAPLVAGIGFLAWRSLAGFPPMPATLRQYSHVSFVDPLTGLVSALRQWAAIHDLPTTLDTLSALLFIALTALMVLNTRWRRVELIAYMLVTLGFLLTVKAEGATSLKAISRYVLTLFPAFLLWGNLLATTRPRIRFILLTTSSGLLLLLSALYALWFFIG